MKLTRWSCGALLTAFLFLGDAAGAPLRTDINPALLYFQAFNAFPELDDGESALLGQASADVGADERELAQRFDRVFELLARARQQKAACDWGADLADGPHAYTPDWRKVRTAMYAAVLRATVALADGDQARMRDELTVASVFSRHAAADAWLVGTMVQIAADGKILDFISAHFDELRPAIRAELAAALKGAPARRTVADAIANEKAAFCDWLVGKIESFRTRERDDAKVLDYFRALMTSTFDNESNVADRIIEASGETSAGVIRYIKAMDPHYARATATARASSAEIKSETAEFEKQINGATNLLVKVAMPNVGRARAKELEFESRLSRLPDKAP